MDELIRLKDDANFKLRKAQELSLMKDDDGLIPEETKTEIAKLRREAKTNLEKIAALNADKELVDSVEKDYGELRGPQVSRQTTQAQPEGDSDHYVTGRRMSITPVAPSNYESFKGKDGEYRATVAGLWVIGKMFGDKQGKLSDHPKVREANRLISDFHPEIRAREERALSTLTNITGGSLVPQELVAAIIERREQYGVYEKLTNRVPANDSTLWPRVTSDDRANFGLEGTTITPNDPEFGDIQLDPMPLRDLVLVNNELMNASAVSVAEFIAKEFARRFAKAIDTAGFTANGDTIDGGIIGAFRRIQNNSGFAGNITATGNTFAAVTVGDLQSLLGVLPEYAANEQPFWICSRAAKELVFGRLQMASGGVTKQETSIGTFDSYSGVPIITTQLAPKSESAMTTGDVFILLADLKLGSFMAVSEEMVMASSDHFKFDTNQTAIRGVMRTDINNYDIGDAANAGSIVGLAST